MEYPITAQRIKEALNEKGISAMELSRRSGVGKAAISHYVNGSHVPHNKNAVLIAKVLDVNPTWLMGFDVDKKVEPQERVDIVLSEEEKILINAYRSNDETYRKMMEMIIFSYKQSKEGEDGAH